MTGIGNLFAHVGHILLSASCDSRALGCRRMLYDTYIIYNLRPIYQKKNILIESPQLFEHLKAYLPYVVVHKFDM